MAASIGVLCGHSIGEVSVYESSAGIERGATRWRQDRMTLARGVMEIKPELAHSVVRRRAGICAYPALGRPRVAQEDESARSPS